MENNEKEVQAAFKTKVTERLTVHPNQWNGEDSAETVLALIAAMKDSKGKPIELSAEEINVINLGSRPTHKAQMAAIQYILSKHDVPAGPLAMNRFARVVGAPAFKMELVKAGKIQDTSAGGLKDLLD